MATFTETYKPRTLQEIVLPEKIRKIAYKFATNPSEDALFFCGKRGTGKTSLAYLIAKELRAQVVHVPSQKCTVERVNEIVKECSYLPMFAESNWRVVIVDEADHMSSAAQLAFLSILDDSNRLPNTLFIFTANQSDGLEDRFMDRVKLLDFSGYGMLQPMIDFLKSVWAKESGKMSQAALIEPDFARILKNNQNSLRGALQDLELEILGA